MLAPTDLEARILYESGGVTVVDKPAGLPSTGRTLDDPNCLQSALMARARRMVWAVHQLDADTSGVNVFVSKRSLVPIYQRRMRFPNARKTYLAICHGTPEFDRRRVALPIGMVEGGSRRQLGVVDGGQSAATRVVVLERAAGEGDGPVALLSCELETGRTHQIRIHLAALGLPLVGEPWYRDPPCALHEHHALHACSLEFCDGAQPDRFEAPLPAALIALGRRLGLTMAKVASA